MSGHSYGYSLTAARSTFTGYLAATKALAPKADDDVVRTESELASHPGAEWGDLVDDFFDHANGVLTGTRQFLGPLLMGSSTGDAANKDAYYLGKHYTNAEESIAAIAALARTSNNYVDIGGGVSTYNAATDIRLWTGATTTTTTGTLRAIIDGAGLATWYGSTTWGSASPTLTVGDGTGSPRLNIAKSDAGNGAIQFLSNGFVRYLLAVNASKDIGFDRYSGAGAYIDSPFILDSNGKAYIGAAGGGDIHQMYGLGLTAQDVTTDATDKLFGIYSAARSNANGPWQAMQFRAVATQNILRLGGITGVLAATDIEFLVSTAVGATDTRAVASISPTGTLRTLFAVTLDGYISPAQLASGDTDNYAPTGIQTCTTLRARANAAGSNLTGIEAPTVDGGKWMLVINTDTAGALTLVHDATSTAANRFLCPNSANLVIPPNGCRVIWYDTVSDRWRVFGAVA